MIRNHNRKKSGISMGWHWYRRNPDDEAFPIKVYTVNDIEFAWLCDPRGPLPETKPIEECKGEFLGELEPPR